MKIVTNPADIRLRAGALITARRAAWALALAGLALRLAFALLPLSIHLVVLEDDAWMVTAIARNFALGRGITADGITTTTGFQPLYPLTLGALPFLAAPHALDFGFSANLVICALLNTLAAWPLWALAHRFGGTTAAVTAVALFALNPLLIRASVNAMETSLGLLLLLTLFAAFYRLDLARARSMLLLALLTALAVLARLDASLAFAAITLTLALRAWRRRGAGRGPQGQAAGAARVRAPPQWGLIALYVVSVFVLLAPYFAFNYAVSGALEPSSGTALAYMHSYRGDFNLTNGVQSLRLNSAVWLGWTTGPAIPILLALIGAALCAWLLGWRLGAALPLLLYLPAPPLYYGYLLQQSRERYFIGLSAILIILIAWLGAELARRWRQRAGMLALAGAALIIMLNTGGALAWYRQKRTEPEQIQPVAYRAALWIRDHLPPGALIGAKNSGIYQYYAQRPVLNIDGKLNHEIVPQMERRALLDYLRARGVEYLVDGQQTMARHISFYSAEFGPAPYHRAPTLAERIAIYATIAANRWGARLPLALESPTDFTPTRPFTAVAVIVQAFDRPGAPANPLVIYRLTSPRAGAHGRHAPPTARPCTRRTTRCPPSSSPAAPASSAATWSTACWSWAIPCACSIISAPASPPTCAPPAPTSS